MIQFRRRVLIGALVALGSAASMGCSAAVTSGSAVDGARSELITPVTESPTTVAATPSPTTSPPTTAAPTTAPPATDPPALAPEASEPAAAEIPVAEPQAIEAPAAVVSVAALDQPVQAVGGRSGGETARVQLRLLELGFWLSGADGGYGLTTTQAVMAFQKYTGLDASGKVDQATAGALSASTVRPVARADSGTLVEIDKSKQLLFFVIDGRTEWILNTSTGNGEEYTEEDKNTPGEVITGVSLTPDGLHRVNRERPDGWWEGDLGEIYRPKYFVGGVAVHGSNSIPNYPASHGCVRVSVPAMDWIWDSGILPLRTPVWVHGG